MENSLESKLQLAIKSPNNPFKKLKKYLGKEVTVEYIKQGITQWEYAKLKQVRDYAHVLVESTTLKELDHISFVGYTTSIKSIKNKKGEIIYQNPNIPENYNQTTQSSQEIQELFENSFGFDGLWKPEIRVSENSQPKKKRKKNWYMSYLSNNGL